MHAARKLGTLTSILVLTAAALVAQPQSLAASAVCGNGCQLFTDVAAITADTTNPFSAPIRGHAETSSLLFNGQNFMYYRTFIDETGQDCSNTGVPQGVALATSPDGQTWTAADGGKPLSALRSVGGRYSSGTTVDVCNEDAVTTGVPNTWVYAPDVIVDGTQLVMVVERRDRGVGANAGFSNAVYYVTSTDGINWSNQQLLLSAGAPAAWDQEIGTPDIEKDGSQYLLTFHGNNAANFRRGVVTATSIAGLTTAVRTPFVLDVTPAWASYGIGMGDIRKEPDGYWYMIFEAFAGGGGGGCGLTVNSTAIGVARSSNAIDWTVRPDALIYGLDGKSCGFDMPAWQNVGTQGFVTTNEPPQGQAPVRWTLVSKTAPTLVPSSAHSLGPNEYLPATNYALQSAPTPSASRLVMQTDGNLVHYRNSDNLVLWASETNGTTAATKATQVVMQLDGNLVFLNASGQVVASTGSAGHPDARLFIDASIVSINTGGYSVWSTPLDGRGMN